MKPSKLRKFIAYSLNAPKLKRTHVYASHPNQFDIMCPRGKRHKIDYSEFESHIWCYKCEKDYFLPFGSVYTGIFNGPIPIQTAKLMGCDFRRINIDTHEIVDDAFLEELKDQTKYNSTWVRSQELTDYDNKFKEFENDN